MATEMVLIKWIGNNSLDYDGKEHYVPIQKLVQKDAKEGDVVNIKWIRKLWKGIVVSKAMFRRGKKIAIKGRTRDSEDSLEPKKKRNENKKKEEKNSGKILCVGSTFVSCSAKKKSWKSSLAQGHSKTSARRILFSPQKKQIPTRKDRGNDTPSETSKALTEKRVPCVLITPLKIKMSKDLVSVTPSCGSSSSEVVSKRSLFDEDSPKAYCNTNDNNNGNNYEEDALPSNLGCGQNTLITNHSNLTHSSTEVNHNMEGFNNKGNDEEFHHLNTEDIGALFEKVPFNPSFQIPLPDYAEVNPYNPNLLRLKPRVDTGIQNIISIYKPKRKINYRKQKPAEQEDSLYDSVSSWVPSPKKGSNSENNDHTPSAKGMPSRSPSMKTPNKPKTVTPPKRKMQEDSLYDSVSSWVPSPKKGSNSGNNDHTPRARGTPPRSQSKKTPNKPKTFTPPKRKTHTPNARGMPSISQSKKTPNKPKTFTPPKRKMHTPNARGMPSISLSMKTPNKPKTVTPPKRKMQEDSLYDSVSSWVPSPKKGSNSGNNDLTPIARGTPSRSPSKKTPNKSKTVTPPKRQMQQDILYDFVTSSWDPSPNTVIRKQKMRSDNITCKSPKIFHNMDANDSDIVEVKTDVIQPRPESATGTTQKPTACTIPEIQPQDFPHLVDEVVKSKNWKFMQEKGPAALTRALIKSLFTKEELITSSYAGKAGGKLDPQRISLIQDTVLNVYEVPLFMQSPVWKECRISITQMLKHLKKNQEKDTDKERNQASTTTVLNNP